MNGRWISNDSQEARDQMLAEAILGVVLIVGLLVFMAFMAFNCGGAGMPLCK